MFWFIGAKVTNGIRSSQRQRNQVINFVVASLVLRDSVLGVGLPFKPCWHCSHLFGVARNTHGNFASPGPPQTKGGESIKGHRLGVEKSPTAPGRPEPHAGKGIGSDNPAQANQAGSSRTDDRIHPVGGLSPLARIDSLGSS
jgi:hypothetical protein